MDKTYIIATLERKHDALAESHAELIEALRDLHTLIGEGLIEDPTALQACTMTTVAEIQARHDLAYHALTKARKL